MVYVERLALDRPRVDSCSWLEGEKRAKIPPNRFDFSFFSTAALEAFSAGGRAFPFCLEVMFPV